MSSGPRRCSRHRSRTADTRSAREYPEPRTSAGRHPRPRRRRGVQPGDTPPDAGQTSGLSHPQPNPSRVMPVFAILLIALIVLGVAAFFVARAFALFD
ncbi:DUF6480 family protein [Rhodococcus aetherivorans]